MGDPGNQVHHIGDAARAFAALFELAIDLRRHDDLPRVIAEQVFDNPNDFPVGNNVALTDEHMGTGAKNRAGLSADET
jgi:hypothetical protein